MSLAQDIYKTVDKGVEKEKLEGALKESLPALQEILTQRLGMRTTESQDLRMSSFGTKCLRKLWYAKHKPEKAEELAPYTRIKFLYGDVVEWLMLFLLSLSGAKVTGQQSTLELEGVKGHRDAIVNGKLIDVKSANSRGFEKFRTHSVPSNDPFGYMDQLGLYLAASKDEVEEKNKASFLAFDKEMGHVVEDTYVFPDKDWTKEIQTKKTVVDGPNIPDRGHEPIDFQKSGNKQLCVECRYCAWKSECHPDLRTFLYSSGPIYLTKVVSTPNVQEV